MLEVKIDNENACFTKSYPTDAGFDLAVVDDIRIESESNVLADSGVAVSIPEGYFGLLVGRSSLSSKLNCVLVTGVIDSGYHANILMNIYNSDAHFPRVIKKGTRVAQLIIMPIFSGSIAYVSSFSKDTSRGDKGFGSTGE